MALRVPHLVDLFTEEDGTLLTKVDQLTIDTEIRDRLLTVNNQAGDSFGNAELRANLIQRATPSTQTVEEALGVVEQAAEDAQTEAAAAFARAVLAQGEAATASALATTALQPADVVDDLTTGGVAVPLSAEQGKVLADQIAGISFFDPFAGATLV